MAEVGAAKVKKDSAYAKELCYAYGKCHVEDPSENTQQFKVVQVHYIFAIRFSSILFFPYFYHVPTILVNHKQVVIRHS